MFAAAKSLLTRMPEAILPSSDISNSLNASAIGSLGEIASSKSQVKSIVSNSLSRASEESARARASEERSEQDPASDVSCISCVTVAARRLEDFESQAFAEELGWNEPRSSLMMKPLLEEVTLVVYGWKSVEPGTLAWVFPSLGAAVAAAHAMRNAVRWAILRGRRGDVTAAGTSGDEAEVHVDVDVERERGAVLVEQFE